MLAFTIAARELRSYFHTTIGWLVLAGFLFITGVMWSAMLWDYVVQSATISANPYMGAQLNVIDWLLVPYFGNVAVVLIFLCPALSMRLFADELKSRSIELLLTSPVSSVDIVIGKFLGALGFVAVMLLGTAYVPFTLGYWGAPDWGTVASGYLSLLALAGAMLALGMLFSAFTPNAVVALVLGFSFALASFVLLWFPWEVARDLSVAAHMESFTRGAIKLSDATYYVVFIGFFLFATHQRVEGYRWR